MTDPETPTFQVVDRRSSVQTPETETSSEPLSETEHSNTHSTSETAGDAQSEVATDSDFDIDSNFDSNFDSETDPSDQDQRLPDPTALLNYVAMQMDSRLLAGGLLGVFASHAWRALGLMPHPVTGDIKMDLPEAQLAIDCVQFLLGKVEKDLPEPERREMHRRLNDLRMNYLDRMRK